MPTNKRTISVRLDQQAERRLEKAAALLKQSRGAFLGRAGDAAARRVLLEWATARYRLGERSLSELADETGLAIEEIMLALEERGREEGYAMFLASSRAVAELHHNPEFLRSAEEAVRMLRSGGA